MDYLSDWNLAMPLALKNNLNIHLYGECHDDESICYSQFKEYATDHINPLRAICEVLVQIGIEKSGK